MATMPPVRFFHWTSRQPTSVINSARLRRPGQDRLHQVVVGRCVRRDHPEAGHHMMHVPAVGDAERRPGGGAELADQDASARPGDPQQFGQPGPGVVHIAQAVADRHRVEAVVGERQRQRVAGHEPQIGVAVMSFGGACRAIGRWGTRWHRLGPAVRRRRCRQPDRGCARPAGARLRPARPCART